MRRSRLIKAFVLSDTIHRRAQASAPVCVIIVAVETPFSYRSAFELFYVIHAQPQRQRLQRRFHGVPAEIFVNPPHTIRGYFENEHRDGRPCTVHMFVTGCQ